MTLIRLFISAILAISFSLYTHAERLTPVPAVMQPNNLCTLGLNSCGNSDLCICEDGYSYNRDIGYCVIEDIDQAEVPGIDSPYIESACSIQVSNVNICILDVNHLGYHTACDCRGMGEYDARLGQCVISADSIK